MRRIIVADREVSEIEDGRRKELGKRQMERNGRLANLVARSADHGDVRRFLRAVDWNYM